MFGSSFYVEFFNFILCQWSEMFPKHFSKHEVFHQQAVMTVGGAVKCLPLYMNSIFIVQDRIFSCACIMYFY